MTAQEVANKVDGVVLFETALYSIPPKHRMMAGYRSLRKMAIWSSEKTGQRLPTEVMEVLSWLGATWGSKKDQKRLKGTKRKGHK